MEGKLVGRIASKPLTAKQVETEKREGYYADGACPGLNLQVVQGQGRITRSWLFRYTSPTTRKRRELGLGSTRVRSLADARKLANDFRLQILDGRDPKDEKDKQRAAAITERAHRVTFDEAVRKCLETKSLEWKNVKHGQQWINTLNTYASPLLGKQPVELITTDLVYKALEPIWVTKTETASRVRQRIEVVMDWCKARGYLKGENPARLKGALGELLPKAQKIKKVEHHAAIHYTQVHEFVTSLRALQGTAPLALEFMLLTAARTGEVVGSRWDEIDMSSKVWTVPAERMKAGREHRVPLCSRAIDILKTMRIAAQNDFIFPGHSIQKNPHLSTGAFLAVFKRLQNFKGYTPHGLRSCFRDWASEKTLFQNETLELALAHTIKNKAEAAYRRQDQLEKRVKLMQQWQEHVENTQTTGSVLSLQRTGHA
jgi:integrase